MIQNTSPSLSTRLSDIEADDAELNQILESGSAVGERGSADSGSGDECDSSPKSGRALSTLLSDSSIARKHRFCQWSTADDKTFFPASKTVDGLRPGVYEVDSCPDRGLYFQSLDVRTEGLLQFPQTNSQAIIQEIQTFWEKELVFHEYGIAYKRGILMWGPPGSGKTSTIGLLTKDIIDRGGIVIKFTTPGYFSVGFRVLREIEPEKPVVVLMEDIDATIRRFNESDVLNILDGVGRVHKCVFLATTNYPQELGPRIVNRPSRFDKRFKIGHPNAQSRRIYLEHLRGGRYIPVLEMERWVAETEGFSLAHLKELFVAVVILNDPYEQALKTLSGMKNKISSDQDEERSVGLRGRGVGGRDAIKPLVAPDFEDFSDSR